MADAKVSPFSTGDGDLEAEVRSSSPCWIKVPARQTILVCLFADLPIRFAVHFVNGGPQLCWGRGHCGHCADRRGFKVHYVYPAWDRTRRFMGAVDLPVGAERTVAEVRMERGFVKGMVFALKKEGGVENGRIVVEPLHQILDLGSLPPPMDVEELLCRQYGLERALVETGSD